MNIRRQQGFTLLELVMVIMLVAIASIPILGQFSQAASSLVTDEIIQTAAQLSHPNILEIHDFGTDDGIVYAVTELLEGKDLRDRMRGSMLP